MRQTVAKPAIDHGSVRTDALVIAVIAALCIFELGLVSQFSSEPIVNVQPAAVITAEVEIAPPVEAPQPDIPREAPDSLEEPAQVHIASAPAFITLFGMGDDKQIWARSGHANPEGYLGVDWKHENVSTSADGLSLMIKEQSGEGNDWTSAELHSHQRYGYGRYETVMRPAKGSGLVSAFFTYVGPYHGEPHDEIDIEFVGNHSRQVEFNYYRNGKRGGATKYDLPFDASEAFHLYAFEWRADGITWSIDGVPVYRTEPGDTRIPQTPSKIVMSIWTGKDFMAQWHGEAQFQSGSAVEYACVSFTPLGSESRSCGTLYNPRPAQAMPNQMLSGSWATRAVMTARAQQPG